MVEANARLAVFIDIKTSPGTFFNKTSNRNDETLCTFAHYLSLELYFMLGSLINGYFLIIFVIN